MEKIILRRLTYHLDTRNLLPEEQYGFRKGHGTIDQLLFFTQKMLESPVRTQIHRHAPRTRRDRGVLAFFISAPTTAIPPVRVATPAFAQKLSGIKATPPKSGHIGANIGMVAPSQFYGRAEEFSEDPLQR
ncbi:hypothetical protein LAZ67_21001133, partial [Cordylochernes scorpioides]